MTRAAANEYLSTRVLVNTGSNLIQAAEVVEGGGGSAYINGV